jgi:hypothetical protein
MNPQSAMARLEALPGWRWIVSRLRRARVKRSHPFSVELETKLVALHCASAKPRSALS